MTGGPRKTAVVFTIERGSTNAECENPICVLREETNSDKANEKLLKALRRTSST
jgi:hypothetical protein